LKIAFACPHCAKQLSADVAAAGRTGRCRGCGRSVVVPSGYTLRPLTPTKTPALAASDWDHAELGPPITLPAAAKTTSPKVKLTPSRAASDPKPVLPNARSAAESSPWLVNVVGAVTAVAGPSTTGSAVNNAAPMLVAYRSFFALLGKVTTWISETSYTVSFLLVILAIAGGMIGRHSLAALACAAIVVLNLVGLAGDITSLVWLSFRKNPLRGVLFLVPPFTLYYLWTDWPRYQDTIHRMRTPLVTLAAVAAMYVFVPWLRGGSPEEGRIVASVKQVVATVEEKVAGRQGALDEGLKKARSWLREVPLPDPSALPGLPGDHRATPGRRP